ESLVVTDYDAGRYMKALFADRFAAREEGLRRAADATEIFSRASLPASFAPKQRASNPPPLPVPQAPPTTRDVHEAETAVGIAGDVYSLADPNALSDSNEVYTQVMGENERAAL